jgi:hypothetical protein
MKTVYIKRNDLLKNISLVLCNNVEKVDESFVEDNMHLYWHDCDTCKDMTEEEREKCEDCAGSGQHESEMYQTFLCHLDDYQQERFKEYDVPFGYSEALETHVLPIYDYGTSWSAFSYSKEVEDDYQLAFDETLARSTVY